MHPDCIQKHPNWLWKPKETSVFRIIISTQSKSSAMENTNFTFIGTWYNETSSSITVTVVGQHGSITIGSNASSEPMPMQLSGWLSLDVLIANTDVTSNPILLWEDPTADQIVILQQALRFGAWEEVKVKHQGLPYYKFHVIETDGLLIVGTVELIELVDPT
jgi:hypothetical protein